MSRLIDADAPTSRLKAIFCKECIETFGCVCCSVGDYFEEIDDAPTIDAVPLWVSVKDRLPTEATGCVLVCMPKGKVRTGQYSEYSKQWYIGDMCGVGGDEPIAWMPLPEPPKEE